MKRGTGQNLYYSVLVGLAGLTCSVFYVTSDALALSFGGNALSAGYFVAVYAAGAFGGHILWGRLADRYGKTGIIRLAAVLLAGSLILVFLSPYRALTGAGILVMGGGASAVESMSGSLLVDANPAKASRWLNLSQVCFCVGAIAAPVLAVWYRLRLGRAQRELFLLLAIVLCGLVLLTRPSAGMRQPGKGVGPASNIPFSVLRSPPFVCICLMILCYCGCEALLVTYLKPYFLRCGSGEAASALAVSLFWLCMIAARLVSAARNGGETADIRAHGGILLVGLACLCWPALRWPGVLLVGIGCGPLWCHLFVLGSRQHPERSGAAFAVMSQFAAAANSVAPVVFGSWVGSLRATFALCILLTVLMLAALWRYGNLCKKMDMQENLHK